MIITRTPFRVSFVGGGSDLKSFYSRNGYGAVIGAAIKKYMYIVIHPYFQDKIRIKYSKTEDVDNVDEIQHPIVRECLKKVEIERGLEIASFADVSAGSGLGSSSAFTVGLLNALYAYKGKKVSKQTLAEEACEIEVDILGEPIGKQDQYITAHGNINYIRFNKDETVNISPISLTVSGHKNLEDSLSLYYIGGERRSGDILAEQKNNMSVKDKFQKLKKMVTLVDELKKAFDADDITALGDILNKGWLYKKDLASNISNKTVDNLYARFIKLGAKGGKLLGAGGGGFLLIYAENHSILKKRLMHKTLPFVVDTEGTKVIFKERPGGADA